MTPYERYIWLLQHYFRIFGILMRIFSAAGIVSLLIERLNKGVVENFGLSLIFCTVFFVVGYWVSRLAQYFLDRPNSQSPEYLKIVGWYQSTAGVAPSDTISAPAKLVRSDMRNAFYLSLGAVLAVIIGAFLNYMINRGSLEKGQWALLTRNYSTALKLLEPLAKQGNSDAQIDLGRMFENGWGVKQDLVEAYYWYRVEKWYQTDNKYRAIPTWNQVEDSLTDKEKSEVSKRMVLWKPSRPAPMGSNR